MKLSRLQIEKWCGPEVLERADKFVKQGMVLRSETQGNTITGSFPHNGTAVKCSFDVKDNGLVVSRCPCYVNQKQGQICVHVAAIALVELQKQNDPVKRQNSIEEERHAKRAQNIVSSPFKRSPRGLPSKFLIELSHDFYKEFQQGAVTIRTIVLIGERPVLIENIHSDKVLSFSPEDDTIIDVLEDIAEGRITSKMQLSRIDFLGLLDVCRGKKLYVSDSDPIEVNSRTSTFGIEVSLDLDSGELILKPQAGIPDEPECAWRRYLAELEKSFVLTQQKIWPLKPTLPLPYHGLYDGEIRIERTSIIPFITHELPKLAAKVNIEFEDGLSIDAFTIEHGDPAFHLTLSGTLEVAFARLDAVYGAKTIPAASVMVPGAVEQPDPENLLNFYGRNLIKERKALSRITAYGFIGQEGDRLIAVKDQRKILNVLGGLIPSLRRLGWTVTVEGRLGEAYDEMTMAIPIVKITPGSHNCFEVQIDYEDGKGKSISQPAMQQAINRGDSFFTFEGRRLLVDSDAIESMRRIFSDCEVEASYKKPGTFRLKSVYAPYVDSSLNSLDGIDVERPNTWRQQADAYNRDAKLEPVHLGELENTLRPYQKTGVYWMRFLEKSGFSGILADEMGLGKTLQTLTWLSLERTDKDFAGLPALVVAPTSLVENWHKEAEKFTPKSKCLVMQGTARHDKWDEIEKSDIVITSYALLRRDLEKYSEYTFSAAILDEAQHIKNRSTQNAIAAKKIRAKARLVLTGTPIENSVADLWSIMDFLMPGYLRSYDDFKTDYEIPISAGGQYAEAAQARLNKKLRPFLLRRLKKDVAKDLPDKIIKVSYSKLSKEQEKIYSALLQVYREKINTLVAQKGFGKVRMDVLAMLLRLRQICCHLALLPSEMLGKTNPDAPSGKLDQFLDLLDEAMDGGHRMLVFSQYVGMLTILRKALEERGIRYCYLDGSTKDRLGECRKYNQDPTIPVFLISLKAGGTGLNLTGADMVVHFDPWWNPAVEDQATDRAHRIGQKRTVCSVKLIAENTIEEKVLEMQRKKQAVIQATVGTGDNAIMQSLTFDDIKELLS